LIFTFTSEKFVKEPLKDDDPSVVGSIITDGSKNEACKIFDDDNSGNRFSGL
jgi:hypothetical protein